MAGVERDVCPVLAVSELAGTAVVEDVRADVLAVVVSIAVVGVAISLESRDGAGTDETLTTEAEAAADEAAFLPVFPEPLTLVVAAAEAAADALVEPATALLPA